MTESLSYQSTLFWEPTISPKFAAGNDRVGCRGDPVAEFMRFGWVLMSPGAETDLSSVCLAVNSTADYERLCVLDVLGLSKL